MNEIIKIIKRLQSTTKTNEKIDIFQENKSNKLLQKVLFYTYNDFYKYKITENFFNKSESFKCENKERLSFTDIFTLLDILKDNNINDNLRYNTLLFLNNIEDKDLKELYKCMILKDLKINCNSKIINKVWTNLIPTFDIQLAENYFDRLDYIQDKDITITPKLDGHRTLVFVHNKDNIQFFTRQGKEIDGLNQIKEELKNNKFKGMILDGEIITTYNISPNEQYKETSKLLRKKGDKENLKMVVFDYISIDDFNNKKSNINYGEKEIISFENKKFIENIEILYRGRYDNSTVNDLLQKLTDNNYEGLMININNLPYQFKRSKNLLKVKKMQTADVLVKSIEEGTGKNKNKLGAIEIEFEYQGNRYACHCGSGFNDEQRELYFNNKELLLNKVVEVQYFEITQNDKGTYGLRFPVFKHIREDKNINELNV